MGYSGYHLGSVFYLDACMPPPDPKLLSFQPLFYSPLTVFEVPHSAALNQQLMAEATAMRQLSEGVSVSNVDGWHSDFDLFDRKEPGCKLLCQHIRTSIEQTTRVRCCPTSTSNRPSRKSKVGSISCNRVDSIRHMNTPAGLGQAVITSMCPWETVNSVAALSFWIPGWTFTRWG